LPQGATMQNTPQKATTLLDHTFDEGVALTMEVRNYIAYHEHADRREFDLTKCLQVGYQHTRVSARLIQVMTWLLAMKALLAGEISPEQFATPQYAMTVTEECDSPSGSTSEELPAGLRNLLERSHALYSRIQRLDGMVRKKLDAGEVPNFAMLTGGPVLAVG
jgi:regulator of CtrA degradation